MSPETYENLQKHHKFCSPSSLPYPFFKSLSLIEVCIVLHINGNLLKIKTCLLKNVSKMTLQKMPVTCVWLPNSIFSQKLVIYKVHVTIRQMVTVASESAKYLTIDISRFPPPPHTHTQTRAGCCIFFFANKGMIAVVCYNYLGMISKLPVPPYL